MILVRLYVEGTVKDVLVAYACQCRSANQIDAEKTIYFTISSYLLDSYINKFQYINISDIFVGRISGVFLAFIGGIPFISAAVCETILRSWWNVKLSSMFDSLPSLVDGNISI